MSFKFMRCENRGVNHSKE